MTDTLLASLAALGFFFLLIEGTRRGFGLSALPPRARTVVGGVAGMLFPFVVYVAVRLLDGVEALRPLAAFFDRHRETGLLATLPAAAAGFALFMGGILHLLLTSSGPSEAFTLAELGAALRTGRWRRSRTWRRRIVILLGVALFAYGLFGLFIVVGPVGVKLLLAAVLLYAAGALAVRAAHA